MSEDEDEQFFSEPVEIPIGDSLDLHYFPPRDVGEIVDAYLEAAAERGLREVRIIHGRGRGVQRHRVHVHLARSPYVERFSEAPADRGGWGATLVWLRLSRRIEVEWRDALAPLALLALRVCVRAGKPEAKTTAHPATAFKERLRSRRPGAPRAALRRESARRR